MNALAVSNAEGLLGCASGALCANIARRRARAADRRNGMRMDSGRTNCSEHIRPALWCRRRPGQANRLRDSRERPRATSRCCVRRRRHVAPKRECCDCPAHVNWPENAQSAEVGAPKSGPAAKLPILNLNAFAGLAWFVRRQGHAAVSRNHRPPDLLP